MPRMSIELKEKEPEARPKGAAAVYALRDLMCKWPIGEPGQPGFHFCCQKRMEGSPYCKQHAQEALRV